VLVLVRLVLVRLHQWLLSRLTLLQLRRLQL
jgi:hypothetical protein